MGDLGKKAKGMMNDMENKAHEIKGRADEKMEQAKRKAQKHD